MAVELEGVVRRRRNGLNTEPLTFTLEDGKFYVLLGPTGAGKSGFLRLLAGLELPVRGRILRGTDSAGNGRSPDVGLVVQEFVNYPNLTVFENIAAPLRNAGRSLEETREAVYDVARRLQITDLLQRLPAELSGGQQQRTALARALAKDPGLLLLDEPLVNLDFKLRESLREDLMGGVRTLGSARHRITVYATAEPEEALLFQSEVIVLNEGAVLALGPAAAVYHGPPSTVVARLTGDPPMNLLGGRVLSGQRAEIAGEEFLLPKHLAMLPSGACIFGFRAQSAFLFPSACRTRSFPARVELAELSGSETFLHVLLGTERCIVRESGLHRPAIGSAVSVHLDLDRLYAFREAGGELLAGPDTR